MVSLIAIRFTLSSPKRLLAMGIITTENAKNRGVSSISVSIILTTDSVFIHSGTAIAIAMSTDWLVMRRLLWECFMNIRHIPAKMSR